MAIATEQQCTVRDQPQDDGEGAPAAVGGANRTVAPGTYPEVRPRRPAAQAQAVCPAAMQIEVTFQVVAPGGPEGLGERSHAVSGSKQATTLRAGPPWPRQSSRD